MTVTLFGNYPFYAQAAQTEIPADHTIGWQSQDRNQRAIYLQLSDLYVSLYNRGQLPIKQVDNERGLRIEDLMREQRLHYGAAFPVMTDALVCALNLPTLCDFKSEPAPSSALADMSSHIAGLIPQRGMWRNIKGQPVILPNINFTKTYEVIDIYKRAGDNFGDLLANLEGCEQFPTEAICDTFIKRLNPGIEDFARSEYEGKLRLPALALNTIIDISCPPGTCAGNAEAAQNTLRLRRALITKSPIPNSAAREFDKLNKNLFRRIVPRPFAIDQEAMFSDTRGMFEFDDFPWITTEFPEPYRAQVVVGVIDGPIDASHCDLGPGALSIDNFLPGSPAPMQPVARPDACSRHPVLRGTLADHGTHVIGIIGARLNGEGTVGLNPYAKLHVISTQITALQDLENQRRLADAIRKLPYDPALRVVNMSFGYPPSQQNPGGLAGEAGQDLLQRAIQDLPLLFVVAAGEVRSPLMGRDMSHFCNWYPACLERPNVISVVALSGRSGAPTVPIWADYGTKFSIGALGVDVVSTGMSNNFVKLDGSSMAAPQVTAIASLLLGTVPSVAPVQVKNRLLACANPSTTLINRVFSGTLDATCTLESPTQDRLVLRGAKKALIGDVLYFAKPADKEHPGQEAALDRVSLSAGPPITMDSLYALRRDPSDPNAFIEWFHVDGDAGSKHHLLPLDRRYGVRISERDQDALVVFRTSGAAAVEEHPLSEVVALIRSIDN